ncbi:long-chain fatty acid transport protein [Luteibacter sp. UNCMF331Sha3.1]|uniref:OmpP1/FadL family transporter n=1 Tax=Luteibacter sp. UNCMF331Sha3.1 TaxID=1502760 RepID=UPI0008BA1E43|nr:outer membrane protein transport protein [Luteibacter sp. UNCMF331Sha3.1]SEN48239.1 long-chain fatty acid transport protein [Luteibacter sp. UNCMF331Sha3.1]
MQKLNLSSRPLVAAALSLAIAGALVAPQAANASAFQLKENSAKALGRAFAGSAAAGDDASAIVNNPAAMTLLKGNVFQADVTGINFSTKFHGTATDAQGRPISGGNGGDAGTTIPVPALYFATQVADRWHFGLGLTAPFGFKTEYDSDWKGRYNGVKSDFKSFDATLSASFDVTDDFAVGVSAIAQKTSAELTSAINYNSVGLGLIQRAAAAGALTPAAARALAVQYASVVPPGSDGYAKIKGDDWAYGWQVGGLWKLTPNDRLALSYRSKIKHNLEGTGNFTMPSNVTAVLSNPAIGRLLGTGQRPFTHTEGRAGFTTPAIATASFWHQDEKFGLGFDLSWTKWDAFQDLTVNYSNPNQPATTEDYSWRNSWFASVGGEYYVSDKFTVRGGVAVDSTPTYDDTRSPRVPDSTRKWLAFGVGYKATEKFEINAGYAHIFVNKAHIGGVTTATGDRLVGENDDKGNLLSVSAKYAF